MRPRVKAGRLSDLVNSKHRADWSWLNDILRKIQPGELITVSCPREIEVHSFRSTILTNGARFHVGDWRLSTKTKGRKIHCFLSPR